MIDEDTPDERDESDIAPHRNVEQVSEQDDFQRTDDASTPENVRPATVDGVGQAGQGGAE